MAVEISASTGLLKEGGVVKTDQGVKLRSMLIPTLNAGDTIYLNASYISESKVKNIQTVRQDLTLESMNGYYIISDLEFSGDNKTGPYTVDIECLNGV